MDRDFLSGIKSKAVLGCSLSDELQLSFSRLRFTFHDLETARPWHEKPIYRMCTYTHTHIYILGIFHLARYHSFSLCVSRQLLFEFPMRKLARSGYLFLSLSFFFYSHACSYYASERLSFIDEDKEIPHVTLRYRLSERETFFFYFLLLGAFQFVYSTCLARIYVAERLVCQLVIETLEWIIEQSGYSLEKPVLEHTIYDCSRISGDFRPVIPTCKSTGRMCLYVYIAS